MYMLCIYTLYIIYGVTTALSDRCVTVSLVTECDNCP